MKYSNKKCKHSMCLMTKIGLDYHCNKCGGIVIKLTGDDFKDDEIMNEYQEDLRAELDEEARMENEEMTFGQSQMQNEELEGLK